MRLFSDVRSSCGRTSKAFGVVCYVYIPNCPGGWTVVRQTVFGSRQSSHTRNSEMKRYFWGSCRAPVSHNTHTNNTRARTLVHFCTETAQNFCERNEQMRIDFSVRLLVLLRSRQLENPHTVNTLRRTTLNAPFLARFPLDDTERSLRGGTPREKTRSFYDHYGLIEVASNTLTLEAARQPILQKNIRRFAARHHGATLILTSI